MGIKRRSQRCFAVLACATAALIVLPACTESQQPTNESALRVQNSTSSTSAASLGSDIIPHSKGAELQFECDNPIGVGPTAKDLGGGLGTPGVSDVMAISTAATRADPYQWNDGATAGGLHFQEIGLVLKAGIGFTLSVPAEMRGNMKVGWSNFGYTLTDELVNPGCTSEQATADWLVYPGGFWLKEPGCIPLVVTTVQTIQTIYIPIGKTCP